MSSAESEVGVEQLGAVLAARLEPADTELTLQAPDTRVAQLPDSAFQIKIGNEIIGVGTRTAYSCTDLTRGEENTNAATHAAGDSVALIIGGEKISQGGGTIIASDINSQDASDGYVITADGEGGSNYQAPSGGSQPQGSQYLGNPVSIDDNSEASLTWDTLDFGPALLDITAPALPTIVTAGLYYIGVVVAPQESITVGGWYSVVLDLDLAGADPEFSVSSSPSTAVNPDPTTLIDMIYTLPAGAQVRVMITNYDGVSAVTFGINAAVVQRIT